MPTLEDFYNEKVLTQKDLKKRELPLQSSTMKISQDLFGWKLYSGKKFIECRSEAEARYLKVWIEAGMREISVPKDDEYLKTIVPELEALKKKIDDIIYEYSRGILNRQIRERLIREVYEEITP